MSIDLILRTVEQGLAFGLLAMGVYLTFRILDFPDLTVEGSFPLGAVVTARFIVMGTNPIIATLIAVIAGGCAGIITGLINTKLKIAGLLAGILTMTSLYSINLRIMGKPNIGLIKSPSIISIIEGWGINPDYVSLGSFIIILFVIKILTDYFLHTEMGMSLRATGNNPVMIESLGVNTDVMKIMGLAIANSLVALSGSLVAQYQGFADAGMGLGMIVIGLASVIIGEVVIRTSKIPFATLGVILGAIIYRLAIAIALQMGFAPTDLKIVTAILVILSLGAPTLRKFMIQDEFAEHLLERGVVDVDNK
ncbi:MAG: ABC transporter permease [Halanaerobiales bacterium]